MCNGSNRTVLGRILHSAWRKSTVYGLVRSLTNFYGARLIQWLLDFPAVEA